MIKAHSLSRDILLERPLPNPNEAEDKNARGRVLAIAGSSGVPGAGLLAGVASLRAGAGKVQLAVPQSIGAAAGVAFPECGIVALGETENGGPMPTAQLTRSIQNADAILVGPGLMDRGSARSLVSHCLDIRTDCALVLDAL
ncbi:MAG: NAD(P)H-hydrate dehydratase, partial [Subtercola sp.]|nr:NAD(P)H-hydrate dehydratase [Subtercola sp.]